MSVNISHQIHKPMLPFSTGESVRDTYPMGFSAPIPYPDASHDKWVPCLGQNVLTIVMIIKGLLKREMLLTLSESISIFEWFSVMVQVELTNLVRTCCNNSIVPSRLLIHVYSEVLGPFVLLWPFPWQGALPCINSVSQVRNWWHHEWTLVLF